MLTAIIDYSSGNLHSARKAFEKISASNNLGSVVVTSNPDVISSADRLVLPGDGAFPACKTELLSSEAYDAMVYAAVEKGRPFLGICVGMQILAYYGYENQKTKGLSWINGDVKPLKKFLDNSQNLKIPHMGWNNLSINKNNKLLDNITVNDQFYFVHSYFFDIQNKKNIICNTKYGIDIPAIVNQDNIFGFQFHPEKSGRSGLKILYNWLKLS